MGVRPHQPSTPLCCTSGPVSRPRTCSATHESYLTHVAVSVLLLDSTLHQTLKDELGVDLQDARLLIVPCAELPGFEGLGEGEHIGGGPEGVEPGHAAAALVLEALRLMKRTPRLRCIVLECAELAPFADALRAATALPVLTTISTVSSIMDGSLASTGGRLQEWQEVWVPKVAGGYAYGSELTSEQQSRLINPEAVGQHDVSPNPRYAVRVDHMCDSLIKPPPAPPPEPPPTAPAPAPEPVEAFAEADMAIEGPGDAAVASGPAAAEAPAPEAAEPSAAEPAAARSRPPVPQPSESLDEALQLHEEAIKNHVGRRAEVEELLQPMRVMRMAYGVNSAPVFHAW